ncbi:uncharacterized protein LOC110681779 [Chenopodium quinoa]|uniref:uncharacterized protein LOC110681779 n=1 Tax=Chenopodium quinoa TaxID=63459 RepID=UPI000B78D161|nr:uncharacterized protein LOC110681779 [Chenopodium quinoa]
MEIGNEIHHMVLSPSRQVAEDVLHNQAERGRGRGRGGRGRGGRGGGGLAEAMHVVEPIVVLRRSPRKQSQKQPTLEIQTIQTLVNPTPQIPTPINPTPQISDHGNTSDQVGSSRSSKVFPTIKRKVPLTTARRKGLQVSVSEGSNSLSQGVKSRRTDALTVNLGDDDQNLVSDDDDEEDNYEPVGGDENEDSEDESLDEEDQEEEVSGAIIHDNFAEVFDDGDDDDNYFMRLYRNGELYKDEEFGKIILKPWKLFTDKQHLRDVVRDYCIQCGFFVVVDRATNLRYTVLCSAEGCEWRLHASKLPDGITWAIKSIKNPEHTCSGLDVNNPMVSASWESRVLIEDIRANNDISAKSVNAILFQRFGVQMAISTLYRVKHKALAEIHGSHDESYAFLPKYCEMIKSTNLGSFAFCAWVQLQEPEKPLVFKSIFISFKGVLDGLKACRSLIGG